MNFDEIVAPLGAEAFTRDYLGRQPLHLQGSTDKFHALMNWDVLNSLLGMTTIWSTVSLILVLDKELLPKESYTTQAVGRDGFPVLRPDPKRVQEHLARGATLVLNDIDQLTAELSTFARELEEALGGKVQANLYLSSKRKQAFRAHFDFHDVFATHVMGEKTWMVFQGQAEHPIKHQAFEGWPRERHEQLKGELWREVRLRPGDLLYLPRGQYHYALADDGPCAHIAWGVTYPIGMDAVTYGFERMIGEATARANLPRDRSCAAGAFGRDRPAHRRQAGRAAGSRRHGAVLQGLSLATRPVRPAGADRAGAGILSGEASGSPARVAGWSPWDSQGRYAWGG